MYCYKVISLPIYNPIFYQFSENEAQWGKGQWHDHEVPSWTDELKAEFKNCCTKDSKDLNIEMQQVDDSILQPLNK